MYRTFFIETLGCQMNVLDSELAFAALLKAGFTLAPSAKKADIVLFNTCSIRQHAEDKIYSALGRLRDWKALHPNRVLGVLGCMAQKDKKLIFRRAPHVDLVLGPGQLYKLVPIITRLIGEEKRKPVLEVALSRVQDNFSPYNPLRIVEARTFRQQAFVRIMIGCDQFCTYCIVPSVRGPEQSRHPNEIIDEARQLAEQGCVEITLIGQTVNRYKYVCGDKTYRLPDLLEGINAINGVRRIRFLTNFPRGMSNEILYAVRDLDKVVPFLHVPAQSGSDDVLKRMKRNYTVAEYKDLTDRMYDIVPNAAVTSDFIVGFCGESEGDFEATKELLKYGRFKNSFIFKYSERSGTHAAKHFQDDVPESVKKKRNNELLAIQNEISYSQNREFIGKTVEILVDGKGDKDGQLSGRTECDRNVVFQGDESQIGSFVTVTIEEAAPFTLFGNVRSI